jgi:hypothetical protein
MLAVIILNIFECNFLCKHVIVSIFMQPICCINHACTFHLHACFTICLHPSCIYMLRACMHAKYLFACMHAQLAAAYYNYLNLQSHHACCMHVCMHACRECQFACLHHACNACMHCLHVTCMHCLHVACMHNLGRVNILYFYTIGP